MEKFGIFVNIISKSDLTLLRNFAKDKNIVVCKPDKGRATVILDKNIYVEKMTNISDTSKFVEIKDSITAYTLKIVDKINRFLRNLKNLSLLSDDIYKVICDRFRSRNFIRCTQNS